MAINNYATTLREWENIIRVSLKVTNPALLKSGALGILSNYLASIKFDALQYYSKAFQEMNPGLAQDFNSMLYHASIYGASIEFATASTLSATLVIPEITLSHVNTLIYEIPKNTEFTDTNSIPFTTTALIKIEQGQRNIGATTWDEVNGTRKLSITKAPNPNVPGKYVFLIHTNAFSQYQRKSYSNIVPPDQIVGQAFEYDIGIQDLSQIKSIKAWSNTGDSIKLDQIDKTDFENIEESADTITELDIKFYKFESSNRDKDIFLETYTHSLNFETGDGVHGSLQEPNSQIITEVQTTLGDSGNVPNSEFLISRVQVTEKWANDSLKYYETTLNGISATGAIGGQSIESIESIRNDIFTQISNRDSIITENDYELMFEYNDVRPFVDAKFIDAQAFVFLFNVVRDNDVVVPSTSVNVKETDLLTPDSNGYGGPFYPKYNYSGYELVSPFYYKTNSANTTDAYMVDPSLDISLRGDLRTPDLNVLKEYKVEVAITYDFTTNSSFVEIVSGAQEELDYYFVCDQFRATITSANTDNISPFTYKISSLFTDAFCILNEPMTGVNVHVKNKQGEVLASYSSDGTYDQLIQKQTFYKYFQEVEQHATLSTSSDTMAYLDNLRGNKMSTMVSVLGDSDPLVTQKTITEKYVLRLPYISSDYFFSKNSQEMFEFFNSYFIMNETEQYINYNTLATQTFHNTIDIPPKYYDSIFERNTMPTLYNPKFPIEIEVHADRNQFMTSKYETETDFDIALRIEIIKFLKKQEGFIIEFFETDLEKHLYTTFSPLIKNVKSVSPTLYQVNSSQEIYRELQNNLEFIDVLNFIPPYFHYDYKNLSLQITW